METQERPDTPSLADVITAWIERYHEELHTAFPGRIESYDASTQTANIRPLVRRPMQQADGTFEYEDLPILPAVTVVQPRTAAWALALPVAVGDTVLVICQETSPGAFEVSDGTQPTFPGDVRRHHPAHAVALVGYYPVRKALRHVAPAPDTWPASAGPQPDEFGGSPSPTPPGIVLGSQDDDGPRLAIVQDPQTRQSYVNVSLGGVSALRVDHDGKVHIGGYPAADFVALAAKVDAALASFRSVFNAHVHPSNGVVTGTPIPDPGSTRAASVKGT